MITVDGVRMASTEIQKGEHLVPEVEEGNREYKFKLTDLTDDQLTHRITQLNWRLNEGNDEAIYLIGVEDNGNQLGLSEADLQESLKNLQFIADQVGCEMMVRQLYAGEQGTTAEVHMRRRERMTVEVVQVNVAVAGDLNSGKSTMIGVLCTGQLDNGKGLARTKVLTHNHEVESGLTSCISHHSLNFSGEGEVLNADPLPGNGRGKRIRALSDLELADATTRAVVLMDLAGHAKYLKTTLHGLIGRRPDHCIVCVSATTGLNSITTEHIGVCMYLNVPLVIVITKADCVGHASRSNAGKAKSKHKQRVNSYGTSTGESGVDPSSAAATPTTGPIERLVESIRQILAGPQRTAMMVGDEEQLVKLLQTPAEHSIVPIFTVSNVTGDGLPLLRSYLFQLPTHAKPRQDLQQQSTCVRILGAIGNTESELDRDEVVFPRDEEVYGTKREVRHSSNRYALTPQQPGHGSTMCGIADVAEPASPTEQRSTEKAPPLLRCNSNSEDNLICCAKPEPAAPVTPCAKAGGVASAATTTPANTAPSLPRAHSSPDLPSTTTVNSQGSRGPTPIYPDREFSDFVDFAFTGTYSEPASASMSMKSSPPTSASGRDTPQNSRTKVLIGSIDAGKVTVGEPMLFGPTCKGEFLSVVVTSLRLSNVPVRCASAGQTVTFKLAECPFGASILVSSAEVPTSGLAGLHLPPHLGIGRRRTSAAGLVLLSPPGDGAAGTGCGPAESSTAPPSSSARRASFSASALEPVTAPLIPTALPLAHWEFEAELLVLNHPAKIRVNYEPVVHVGCVKQSAKIISIRKIIGNSGAAGLSNTAAVGKGNSNGGGSTGKAEAGTGHSGTGLIGNDEVGNSERAICRFRFLYYPEFIIRGEAMIIREQRTRGVGTITALL